MSRSRKKNWYVGNCADSDKRSKQFAHRAERRVLRSLISVGIEQDLLPVDKHTFGSAWTFDKDGKSHFSDPKWARK